MNMSEKLSYQGAAHEDCMNKTTVWTRLAVWKALNLLVIHINICMYIQQNNKIVQETMNIKIKTYLNKNLSVYFLISLLIYVNMCIQTSAYIKK